MELEYLSRDVQFSIGWSIKKRFRIEIAIYYMAVSQKDWDLQNSCV